MRTKVILEFCYNHNGEMSIAKQMIDEAAKLGVGFVKFQKWAWDCLPKWIKRQERNPENSFGGTYQEHREALEFTIDELKELREYTEKKMMNFVCSGKDFESIKQLVEEMNIEYLKLPSQRFLDDMIFGYLMDKKQKHKTKILVSSGMHNAEEIKSSKWIGHADSIMHCVSLYPVPLRNCDLGYLAKNMNIYNGYSSHEVEGRACKYAVALGCQWIERHFTLDKTMKGSDHKMSSDIPEMKRIIEEIEEAESIRGSGDRIVTDKEKIVKEMYTEF